MASTVLSVESRNCMCSGSGTSEEVYDDSFGLGSDRNAKSVFHYVQGLWKGKLPVRQEGSEQGASVPTGMV